MYFKSYKSIEFAIQQYLNDYYLRSEVKIRSQKNIHKDERSLIDAAILCKVLKTFEEHYADFSRNYNLKHIGHFFWNNSTFQLKYSTRDFTFELHSSDFIDQPEYARYGYEDKEKCSQIDIRGYINDISNYIDLLLRELKEYIPLGRYESIKDHIVAICNAE